MNIHSLPEPISARAGWPWTINNDFDHTQQPFGNQNPSISIVTPSFNQANYLEETIRSVLLQNYPKLEYIVIDGGSTDGSVEILKKYEPWLSFLSIGPDNGQSAAIAEGFKKATGDILGWINSDDFYCQGALERVANFFIAHPRVVFGNGDVNYVNASGQFVERIYAIRPNRFLTANLGIHGWPQQGSFWRRWAYKKVGELNTSLRFCMDRDLFIRLTGIGKGRRIPSPPLANFRIHDQAKSSTILDIANQESAALIEKYGNLYFRDKKRLLKTMWRFWQKPTDLRSRFNRQFRCEL